MDQLITSFFESIAETHIAALLAVMVVCIGVLGMSADWMVDKGVKVVGHDTQANDHPLATALTCSPERRAAVALVPAG